MKFYDVVVTGPLLRVFGAVTNDDTGALVITEGPVEIVDDTDREIRIPECADGSVNCATC